LTFEPKEIFKWSCILELNMHWPMFHANSIVCHIQ
jgi:hypothetical protein